MMVAQALLSIEIRLRLQDGSSSQIIRKGRCYFSPTFPGAKSLALTSITELVVCVEKIELSENESRSDPLRFSGCTCEVDRTPRPAYHSKDEALCEAPDVPSTSSHESLIGLEKVGGEGFDVAAKGRKVLNTLVSVVLSPALQGAARHCPPTLSQDTSRTNTNL